MAQTLTPEDLIAIADAVWDEDIVAAHTTIDSAGQVSAETRHLDRGVYVDPEALVNGDGTAGSPFDNMTDAKDHAETHGLKKLIVYSEVTLLSSLKNFIVEGVGNPVINCNGQDLKNSQFNHCTMRGTYLDSIVCDNGILDDNFWLNGHFNNCGLNGNLFCIDGGMVVIAGAHSTIAGLTRPTVSMNGAGSSQLSIRDYAGGLTILDCNNVADEATIEMPTGKLTLDATCTDGIISVRGGMYFIDNSAGSTVDITGLYGGIIADETLIRADGIETGFTLQGAMRIVLAALAGKATGLNVNLPVFRDVNDGKDRIVAVTDVSGNRSSVTLDAS